MGRERIFYCSGVEPAGSFQDDSVVRLNLHGKNPNVFLLTHDLSKRLASRISSIFTDLLEIAAYVYSADQSFTRGGSTSPGIGGNWRRSFAFHLPVRNPGFWSSSEIYPALIDALEFLSDDNYVFQFSKLEKVETPGQSFAFGQEEIIGAKPNAVIMFSGGLDSLGGAIEECVNNHKNTLLVTHTSTPKSIGVRRELVHDLKTYCKPATVFHVPIWVNKDKNLGREHTQRTRSFLYAVLGATVAHAFKLSTLKFYENGVTSINLPISEQLVGSRASRTTHPKALSAFSDFFSLVTNERFTIENPFMWKTKTDVVDFIGDSGCRELIKHTISCSRTWERTKAHSHCGKCSQCIDRRFAALASRYAEDDPDEIYNVDLLTGKRENTEQITLLESYVRTAKELSMISDFNFFTKFGEASRVIQFLDGTPDQVGSDIFELHQRHGQQIQEVLEGAVKNHARDIILDDLPLNCLIRLCLPKEKASLSEAPDEVLNQSIFRRDGQKWTLRFENKTINMEHSIGLEYIAFLLKKPLRKEVHVLTVYQEVHGSIFSGRQTGFQTDKKSLSEFGMRVGDDDLPDFLISKEGAENLKKELMDLEEEIQETEENNDVGKLDGLKFQKERIVAYLKSALTEKGRPRKVSSTQERIRKSVSRAISRSITKISSYHDILARHLRSSIQTGRTLVYNPDNPFEWHTD